MSTQNNQFRLRLYPNTAYNFIVDWGDGSSDVVNQTTPVYQSPVGNGPWTLTQQAAVSASWPGITHTYTATGKYTISITEITPGGFPGLQYDGVDDGGNWNAFDEFNNDFKKITKISQWGAPSWNATKALIKAFEGCVNLKEVVTDNNMTSLSVLNDLTNAWWNCVSLSSFNVINTSKITDFTNTWFNCTSLSSFPIIDTSKGVNFSSTWKNCNNLKSFPLINTLSATSLNSTWAECANLKSFPALNTQNVIDMGGTWQYCTSLSSFPLIDTSKVTNFSSAWKNCTSLSSFPLINTSKGVSFSNAWENCTSLRSFPSINTTTGTNFYSTWSYCTSLTSFPLIDFSKATAPYFTWYNCLSLSSFPLIDTSNCTDLGLCWWQCRSLQSFPLINTSKVKNFDRTWGDCVSLSSFPLIDTLSATVRLYYTWQNCSSLKSFPQINTKNTPIFEGAWLGCKSLTAFPLIDTLSGRNFAHTWSQCYLLSSTDFPTLNMSNMVNGMSCFANVKLTTTSYSALLTSLCATNFNSNVVFDGGYSMCNTIGSAARVSLTTPISDGGRGWTITDGGYDPTVWYIGNLGMDLLAYADSNNVSVTVARDARGGWIIPETYKYLNGVIAGQTLPTDIAFKTSIAPVAGSTVRYIAISSTDTLSDNNEANKSAMLGVWNNYPWLSVNADHALLGASNNLKAIINRIKAPGKHYLTTYPLSAFWVNGGSSNFARGIQGFNMNGPGVITLPGNGTRCKLFLFSNLNSIGGAQGSITLRANNQQFATINFTPNWWAQPFGLSINNETSPTWIFPQFANVNITL